MRNFKENIRALFYSAPLDGLTLNKKYSLERKIKKICKEAMKEAFEAAQETHDWDVGPRPDYNVYDNFDKWFNETQ